MNLKNQSSLQIYILVIIQITYHYTNGTFQRPSNGLNYVNNNDTTSNQQRSSKFFSTFWDIGLVRFENSVCPGAAGLHGTCFTRRECHQKGGKPSGKCAKGIGVCCIFQITCDPQQTSIGSSNNNNTYFTNPTFPKREPLGLKKCSVEIHKLEPTICQIKLDFITFSLAQPNENGKCVQDQFTAPINGEKFVLCGENSGQHIHINFPQNSDEEKGQNPNVLRLVFSTKSPSAEWNLKITQISCDDDEQKAPSGCLQYHNTQSKGTLKTFNYNSINNRMHYSMILNQTYGICLMASTSTTIQYKASDTFGFTMSGDTDGARLNGSLGEVGSIRTGRQCQTNFVIIPNGKYVDNNTATTSVDRFCGNAFPTITSSTQPFIVYVVLGDGGGDGQDIGNGGFSLDYQLI